MSRTRVVVPEWLDQLAADDPAARHSRRDLLRIHTVMGTRCAELSLVLAAAAARADRFFACELRRSWLALAGSRLVGAIGANAVTRADAVLSVRAGFRGAELTTRWPQGGTRWQTREAAAGPFRHCFSAWRNGVGA
jgi:hypothetical protein